MRADLRTAARQRHSFRTEINLPAGGRKIARQAEIADRTIAAIARRLVPILFVSYIIAYLDRVNIAFAAPAMMKDLSLSATVFGAGAGIFFLGYVLFEVPSNLALARFGARRWIARIMITWAIASAAAAFVQDATSFFIARFVLGVAEAGFFPGVIFYLGLWLPAEYRARIIGWFLFAIPVSIIIGAPVSGLILSLGGAAGLAGWQWLLILEALPGVTMAFVVWRHLPDRPEEARWLDADQKRWLTERLNDEPGNGAANVGDALYALFDRRVLLLGLIYIGVLIPNYGIGFFLPQIIAEFGGIDPFLAGLINAVPFLFGAAAMLLWARHSDRTRERKWHIAMPAALMAIGFAAAAAADSLLVKIAAISLACFGFAITPVFWTIPATFLRGTAVAAGIATINSIGNLGGYFGPQAFGLITDASGGSAGGLLFLSASGFMAFTLVLFMGRAGSFERGLGSGGKARP